MPNKTNKKSSLSDNFSQIGQNLGMVLMTAAATVGMIELPDHGNSKIIVPMQPALVRIGEAENNNPLRREREEAAPHHISYSEAQRTPARSGKR